MQRSKWRSQPLTPLRCVRGSDLSVRYRPVFGSSGKIVGSAAEFGTGGGIANNGDSGMVSGAKDGLAAGVSAVGIIDEVSSSGRMVPKLPSVEEDRRDEDAGMVAGATDVFGVAGVTAVGRIEAGSSSTRIVPKLPSVEEARCGFFCGGAVVMFGAGVGTFGAGGAAGTFAPLGSSVSGKI